MWLGGCRTRVWRGVRPLTRLPALCWYSVWVFFFFWIHVWLQFAPTRLRFVPNWADSARIWSYRPNQIILAGSQNRPKRLRKAEIGFELCRNSRNRLWMKPKRPKSVIPQFDFEYLLLLLCFLFCFVFCFVFLAFFFLCFVNQGHSNVFFKNILMVKIYRKYK